MSKKQSSTSGLLDPPPVILLDENLSSSDIADELSRWVEDWHIELHRTHFPNPKTPDTEVLTFCGTRGWILVSADDRMGWVPDNKKAAQASAARVFCFPRTSRSGAEYRAALTAGRHRLLKMARRLPPPNFARITFEGNVGFFQRDKVAKDATSRDKTRAKYPGVKIGEEAV